MHQRRLEFFVCYTIEKNTSENYLVTSIPANCRTPCHLDIIVLEVLVDYDLSKIKWKRILQVFFENFRKLPLLPARSDEHNIVLGWYGLQTHDLTSILDHGVEG